MQQLMIWRHAKAAQWSLDQEDFPRELQPEGTRHAGLVAQWMLDHLEPPGSILCSPSQRTRDTLAQLLALQPALEAATHFIPQLYLASTRTLGILLDAAFAEAETVLLVGHNPGLELLVGDVIHRRHYDIYQRLPTGTLVVIDFETGWPKDRGRGALSHFIRGKILSAD